MWSEGLVNRIDAGERRGAAQAWQGIDARRVASEEAV